MAGIRLFSSELHLIPRAAVALMPLPPVIQYRCETPKILCTRVYGY